MTYTAPEKTPAGLYLTQLLAGQDLWADSTDATAAVQGIAAALRVRHLLAPGATPKDVAIAIEVTAADHDAGTRPDRMARAIMERLDSRGLLAVPLKPEPVSPDTPGLGGVPDLIEPGSGAIAGSDEQLIKTDVLDQLRAHGLSTQEAVVWERLREAAHAALVLMDEDCQHTMERAEVCTMFHGLQRWLGARPFQRRLHGLDGGPDDPR